MAKAKATTKQQGRTVANKTKASQKSRVQMAKGPTTKKGTNNQKCPASDGSDDEEQSEKEPKEHHARPRKKTRHEAKGGVDDGEDEEDIELVIDSDTETEEVEQVSSQHGNICNKTHHHDRRQATSRTNILARFQRHCL